MQMGISPEPEVFQRKLMQTLEGLPGVYVIADDVLITGEGATQEEAEKDHDQKVRHFLTRCREIQAQTKRGTLYRSSAHGRGTED